MKINILPLINRENWDGPITEIKGDKFNGIERVLIEAAEARFLPKDITIMVTIPEGDSSDAFIFVIQVEDGTMYIMATDDVSNLVDEYIETEEVNYTIIQGE